MRKTTSNCWPTDAQNLLLKAGLSSDLAQAESAWHQYCQKVDLQDIDYVSSTFLPLVYNNFKKSDTPELNTCKSVYRHNWTENQLQFYKLRAALVALKNANIDVCLLKGAAMIVKYYQDPALRTMGDIDILVPRAQVKEALQVLRQAGWEFIYELTDEQFERMLSQRHAWGMKNKEGSALDLHWALLVDCAIDKSLSEYTYRTCKITLPHNNIEVCALTPEDQVIHTVLHGIAYSPQPLIRWLPDVVMVLKTTSNFDWNYFFNQTQKLKLQIFTHSALNYVHEHQFIQLPEQALLHLKQYRPTRAEKRFFRLITEKPRKFVFAFWSYHVRNSECQNPVILALTLPRFLMKFWQLKHWYQLPLSLGYRIGIHIRDFFKYAYQFILAKPEN